MKMVETENSQPLSYFAMPETFSQRCYDPSHGLPKEFVKSMQTLFEMLDDNKRGQVALTEIERRWRDDAVPNLPGVLDALRAVTPANGLLSFENFADGLRLALHRARMKRALKSSSNLQANTGQYRVPNPRSAGYEAELFSDKTHPHNDLNYFLNGTSTLRGSLDVESGVKEENNYWHGKRRLRHRRSNSGPIFPAKGFLDMKESTDLTATFQAYDDSRIEAARKWESMGRDGRHLTLGSYDRIDRTFPRHYAHTGAKWNGENAASRWCSEVTGPNIRGVAVDKESSPSSVLYNVDRSPLGDLSQGKTTSNFDQITASTLFVNQEPDVEEIAPKMSVKPVVLSGKYIGVTGTVKRTKSSASISQRHGGSLQRPKSRTAVSSMSFNSLFANQSNVNRLKNRFEDLPDDMWKPNVTEYAQRKRSVPARVDSKRAQRNYSELGNERGDRSNSDSPPEVPAEKFARRGVPIVTTSLDSSATTISSAISDEILQDGPNQKGRANSTSSAQRRRNARWNTAAIAFDSPMIKQLKGIQQKENLLRKGLDSVEQIKQCLHVALGNIKRERDHLNARVEGFSSTVSRSGADFDKSIVVGPSVSTALENLEDIVRQFQDMEVGSDPTCADFEDAETSVLQLQEDNTRLINEVTEKQEIIEQLEEEKAALVRQLFQARSELHKNDEDQANTSIFI